MTVREWFRGMRTFDTIGERQMLTLALESLHESMPRLRSWTYRGIVIYSHAPTAEYDMTVVRIQKRFGEGLLD